MTCLGKEGFSVHGDALFRVEAMAHKGQPVAPPDVPKVHCTRNGRLAVQVFHEPLQTVNRLLTAPSHMFGYPSMHWQHLCTNPSQNSAVIAHALAGRASDFQPDGCRSKPCRT